MRASGSNLPVGAAGEAFDGEAAAVAARGPALLLRAPRPAEKRALLLGFGGMRRS